MKTDPDLIRLPDGREFRIRDLCRGSETVFYNLRAEPGERKIFRRRAKNDKPYTKYSRSDRVWLAENPVADIQERYGLDQKRARALKYQSQYWLTSHPEW